MSLSVFLGLFACSEDAQVSPGKASFINTYTAPSSGRWWKACGKQNQTKQARLWAAGGEIFRWSLSKQGRALLCSEAGTHRELPGRSEGLLLLSGDRITGFPLSQEGDLHAVRLQSGATPLSARVSGPLLSLLPDEARTGSVPCSHTTPSAPGLRNRALLLRSCAGFLLLCSTDCHELTGSQKGVCRASASGGCFLAFACFPCHSNLCSAVTPPLTLLIPLSLVRTLGIISGSPG